MQTMFSTTEWMMAFSAVLLLANLAMLFINCSGRKMKGWLIIISLAGSWLAAINVYGWWFA